MARRAVRAAEKLTSAALAESAFKEYRNASSSTNSNRSSVQLTVHHRKLTFTALHVADIGHESRQQVFHLCELNVRSYYEHTPGGWKGKEKQDELFANQARFITVMDDQNGNLAGFINYRFDIEDCEQDDECARMNEDVIEVAYCYEVHVASEYKRLGIGKTLLEMLEAIARNTKMRKVMLTTFCENHSAMQFYNHIGFKIDAISPSQYQDNSESENEMGDYEIMSKNVVI